MSNDSTSATVTKSDGSPAKLKALPEPRMHFIQQVIKGDTYMVLADSQPAAEDDYAGLYFSVDAQEKMALQPPYTPTSLKHLVVHNNILNQCVEAMEVNIDSTGFEFVSIDNSEEEPDPAEEKEAKAFFEEPYPGKSFVQIRRVLRREMESVGYGFIECLRSVTGDLVAFRNMETQSTRFVKLDAPVMLEKVLLRGEKEVKINMYARERRFMQRLGNTNTYYKEFGCTRDLHRRTGEWFKKGEPVPMEDKATELIVFQINPDATGPYGIPRWINQMPSVVGSRKAEEQNLEFFDAGGMPPAIIFIQGGILAKDAADQLRMYLSGMNKNRNRAVVVEAQSSSGTLESSGSVQVKVERFGAERANDAMYAVYDARAEDHVRVGFRLPPLFLGKAQDYNFATAQTAYMVAEAQVFEPERREFDEIINKTIMKALGFKKIKIKSKPITLKDVATQLEGIKISGPHAEPETVVAEVNKIAGVTLTYKEPEPVPPGLQPASLGADGKPIPLINPVSGEMVRPFEAAPPKPEPKPDLKLVGNAPVPAAGKQGIRKASREIVELAHDYATMEGLYDGDPVSEARKAEVLEEVENLIGDDLYAYQVTLSTLIYGRPRPELIHDHA